MSWDNRKTLSFIKEFEKRDVLWRRNNMFFYDAFKKEEAWTEISNIFNEDVESLKRKIISLRGSRRREKNRMLKGRKRSYVSKWFAWESMKFLNSPEKPKPMIRLDSSSSSETEETSEDFGNEANAGDFGHEEVAGNNSKSGPLLNVDNCQEGRDSESIHTRTTPKKTVYMLPKKFTPKRPSVHPLRLQAPSTSQSYNSGNTDDFGHEEVAGNNSKSGPLLNVDNCQEGRDSECIHTRTTPKKTVYMLPKKFTPKRPSVHPLRLEAPSTSQSYNSGNTDECATFGAYVSEKLRKHDGRTRAILQHKIHNLLFETEMEVHDNGA